MKLAKLAANSIFTVDDQIAWYRQEMGDEAAEEQVRLARLATGRCICEPSKVRRKWDDPSSKPTTRTIHTKTCPKFRPWMDVTRK
jgi:hypothetical protein